MFSFAEWRQDIDVLSRLVYLDTAQRGLTPGSVTKAGCAQLMAWQDLESDYAIRELKQTVRAGVGRLLQVDAAEIALVGSTGQGLNTVAAAFPWQSGDNVVVSTTEHPSNFFPWTNLMQRGVEVRLVPSADGSLHPEEYAPFIDARTRLVAASLVSFYPGGLLAARQLADLAHQQGAYLVLDVIQAAGILPVYPRELGADAVAAAGYKGLMSAYGAGFLYVSQQLLSRLKPMHLYVAGVIGELGITGGKLTDPNYTWRQEAALFEPGFSNLAALGQMNQALQIILDLGVERIGERVLALARQLADGAATLGYQLDTPAEHLAGIVCLRMADGKSVAQFLDEQGIKTSARRHGLRMALHGYNNEQDVEQVLAALAEYPERS